MYRFGVAVVATLFTIASLALLVANAWNATNLIVQGDDVPSKTWAALFVGRPLFVVCLVSACVLWMIRSYLNRPESEER